MNRREKSNLYLATAFCISLAAPRLVHAQAACPSESPTVLETSSRMQTFANNNSNGVVWNGTTSSLQNRKEGGLFTFVDQTLSGNPYYMCSADFNGDGWQDIAAMDLTHSGLIIYRNDTAQNQVSPVPNWNNPSYVTAPKFTKLDRNGVANGGAGAIDTTNYNSSTYHSCPSQSGYETSNHGGGVMGCGDINGDGKADIVVITNNCEYKGDTNIIRRAEAYLGNGNGTFQTKYAIPGPNLTLEMFRGMWGDGILLIKDENGDGRNDLILAMSGQGVTQGTTTYNANYGVVRSFRNLGGTQPKFGVGVVLAAEQVTQNNLQRNNRGFQSVGFGDFNGDGIQDLAANGIRDSRVRVFYGLQGGGFSPTSNKILDAPSTVYNKTGGQSLMVADFNLDGKPDIVTATDLYRTLNYGQSARYLHWRNQGAPNFFDTTNVTNWGVLTAFTQGNGQTDSDTGFWMDYDNDPDHTPDLVVAEGSEAVKLGIFANRVQTTYVQCGEVFSDPMPLGGLEGTEIVITGARITPTWSRPTGTSIELFATNEDPANWQPASLCTGSSVEYCVTFPKPVGRTLRWKAKLCANSAKTATPSISGMSLKFQFEQVQLHFRAGAVSDEGVAYVGAFRQPGERGHVYAMSADLQTTYFDLGNRLDVQNPVRKIYTTKADGKTRLNFSTAAAAANTTETTDLLAALNIATVAELQSVVEWWHGMRFGPELDHRLGAIVESTPAVLGPPVKPYYYEQADAATRSALDSFLQLHQNRPKLVFAGSKDGALHAMNTDAVSPVCLASEFSGTEAWAFIPRRVAGAFLADKNAGLKTAFVDGAVTLADVKINGVYRSVALFGLGNGGRSISAIDVTDTVNNVRSGACVSSQTVTGPVSLWEYASADFGLTKSKPVIARTKIGNVEKFLAVVASGLDPTNPTAPWSKGRDVHAIDMETGAMVWRFKAKCPITSDLVGNPVLDSGGFVKEVMFADYCGNFYRVPANTQNTTGWVTGAGTITVATNDDGTPVKALFATSLTPGLLAERPIAGTIAVRQRTAGAADISVYFGTGGLEAVAPNLPNKFYEIDGASGQILNQIAGECVGSRCDKFYGGLVITPTEVIVSRTKDPTVVASGACDRGQSTISSYALNGLTAGTFNASFNSAIQSTVFGSSDGIYATNLGGEVVRIHTTSGGGGGTGGTGTGNGGVALKRRTWRQIF